MRWDRNLTLVLAMTGVLFGARRAAAQSDPFNACAANAGGRLRALAAGASCKRSERPVSWAASGAQGPQGDPGPPGDAGPPACRAIGRLTLPGVVGEGAGGTMVAYAYEIDVTRNTDPAGGPPAISALRVTKSLDKASVVLFQAAVQGTPFASAKLEVFGPAPPAVATTYDLTSVVIASLTQGSPTRCTADVLPEDVALGFASVTISSSP
jgi:hypothetical protein